MERRPPVSLAILVIAVAMTVGLFGPGPVAGDRFGSEGATGAGGLDLAAARGNPKPTKAPRPTATPRTTPSTTSAPSTNPTINPTTVPTTSPTTGRPGM